MSGDVFFTIPKNCRISKIRGKQTPYIFINVRKSRVEGEEGLRTHDP